MIEHETLLVTLVKLVNRIPVPPPPATLPAQIGCLGRALVVLIQPWAKCGRAAASDSTIVRARGGVWHKQDREARTVPHTSIDIDAHWTKSG